MRMTRLIRKRFSKRKPNPQQQVFVDALLSGMSPAEAASAAGYHGTGTATYTPEKAASVLLAKPWVAGAVAAGALDRAMEGEELSAGWLRDKLIAGIEKPMRSSQVQCLLAACRTIPGFFKDKEGAVTINVAIVADLAERLTEGRKRLAASRAERGLPPVEPIDPGVVTTSAADEPAAVKEGIPGE